jgi:sigma-B regulation protein RsbU (phosphoserine phosphatase)
MLTDGVTEAMNPANEIYGTQRLISFLKKAPGSAAPLGEAIVDDVETFCAGQSQRDDICLICLHRLPS